MPALSSPRGPRGEEWRRGDDCLFASVNNDESQRIDLDYVMLFEYDILGWNRNSLRFGSLRFPEILAAHVNATT